MRRIFYRYVLFSGPSAKVVHDLDVGFNEGVGSQPGLIANRNALPGAMNKHPQALHVSESFEQTEDGGNVAGFWGSDLVISLADQFFTAVSEKFAEAVGNLNVLSIIVDHGRVPRRRDVTASNTESR